MKYNFFTCFDVNYINIGLTLWRSLQKTHQDFTLYVCALDNAAYSALSKLAKNNSSLVPIALSDVEAADPEFAACKNNRSKVEYYFTLSPVLPQYLFNKFSGVDEFIYLDADLYFFQSIEPLRSELTASGGKVLICEHGFPPHLDFRLAFGRYNVECQIYRRNGAEAVLAWWRSQCIAWCGDKLDNGRFADQKYLDDFPTMFPQLVTVSRNAGAGVAPWNWPLRPSKNRWIFYHFQGFKFIARHLVCHNLGSYANYATADIRRVYAEYAGNLLETQRFLAQELGMEFAFPGKNSRTGMGICRQLLSAIVHRNLMGVK